MRKGGWKIDWSLRGGKKRVGMSAALKQVLTRRGHSLLKALV